jgi:hypothetical protein
MKYIIYIVVILNIGLWNGCGNKIKKEKYLRDKNTQIVYDRKMSLMWQDDKYVAKDENLFTWYDAIAFCQNLHFGGYSDWRLPNKDELYSLADIKVDGKQKINPAIDSSFEYIVGAPYWTVSKVEGSETDAWYINFYASGLFKNKKDNHYFVRCVRKSGK